MAVHEIVLVGEAYERGFTHGRKFARLIHEAVREYCKFDASLNERVGAFRQNMTAYLADIFPELLEELRGIGDGAGIEFNDILSLNFFPGPTNLPIYCTNIVLPDTSDGPIHGKTSDIGSDYKYYLLQRTSPAEGGEEFLSVGWVGTIWSEVGINSAGLAMGQSSAPVMPGQDGTGIPALVMPRPVLQHCKSTEEAVEFMVRFQMAGKGINVALLDQTGHGVVVEKAFDRQAVREADEGAVFCSNHFVEDGMQGTIPLKIEGIEENSIGRYELLTQVLGNRERVALKGWDYMAELLRIHATEERPGICQHVPPYLTSWYAYIQLPKKREMWICDGPPCQGDFVNYTL